MSLWLKSPLPSIIPGTNTTPMTIGFNNGLQLLLPLHPNLAHHWTQHSATISLLPFLKQTKLSPTYLCWEYLPQTPSYLKSTTPSSGCLTDHLPGYPRPILAHHGTPGTIRNYLAYFSCPYEDITSLR
jgi:hypothetical protein